MLLIFAGLKVRNGIIEKVTTFVSPLVFGVYILHSNSVFRAVSRWNGRWAYLAERGSATLLATVVGVSLAIFVVCCLVDSLRRVFFSFVKSFFASANKMSERGG